MKETQLLPQCLPSKIIINHKLILLLLGAHYEPSSGMKISYVQSIFSSNRAMIFRQFGLDLPITIWNRLIGHAKQKTYYVLLKKSPFSKTPFKKNKLYLQVLHIHYWALYKSYLLKEWRDKCIPFIILVVLIFHSRCCLKFSVYKIVHKLSSEMSHKKYKYSD